MTRMLRRRTVVTLAAGAATTPLRRAGAAETAVTIAVSSNSLAYGGLHIAQQGGLFQQHGLAPKIIVMESGNAAMAAVLGQSAAFSGAGPGEVLAARVRGRDIVIITNVYRGLLGSLILARPVAEKIGVAANAPVEQRLRALDGLSIAAPSATSAYLTPYKSAAEAVGARIRFVYMTQPAMVAAIQVGAVQGMAGAAPFSLTPVVNGSGVLWISGPKGDLPPASRPTSSACLQTTADYASQHPEMVRALRAVFLDVGKLIKQHPEQAKALLAKAYPQLEPALLDAAFAESADNWAQSVMSQEDIRQEIRIQESAGTLPGVGAIDPAAVLFAAP